MIRNNIAKGSENLIVLSPDVYVVYSETVCFAVI